MANRFQTKLEPAPVQYPNGGGLQKLAITNGRKRQQLEREVLSKQQELDRAKLAEKHSKENKPTVKKK